jgi:hypothetical protein
MATELKKNMVLGAMSGSLMVSKPNFGKKVSVLKGVPWMGKGKYFLPANSFFFY